MRTTVNKHKPHPWEHANPDGLAWTTEMPKDKENLGSKVYTASIPDKRIDHCSFESFGWHKAWADTIEELIEDIRSFGVPYYSEQKFLSMLKERDVRDTRFDRQVELYFDGRGTTIKRGHMTLMNMTEYTSL